MSSLVFYSLVVVCMAILQKTSGWFFVPGVYQPTTLECQSNYIELLRSEISSKPCISTTEIWSMLEPMAKHHHDHSCLKHAISEIAAYTSSLKDPAGQCHCIGDFQKNTFHHISRYENVMGCFLNSDCLYLFDYFYLHYGHHNERSECKTHHHVWNHLRDMQDMQDMQTDWVHHLSATFSNGLENTCKCTEKAPLELSTTSTVSASKTPLIKMTSVTTTEPPASATSGKYEVTTTTAVTACDKFAVLISLAKDTQVDNQNATDCLTGSHSSSDALVLSQCNVSSTPSSWKQGINVMSDCVGAKSLPSYTPIALFENGMYPPKGSISGIFLHCTPSGFSFVSQSCDDPPHVIDVALNGTKNFDPSMIYSIS